MMAILPNTAPPVAPSRLTYTGKQDTIVGVIKSFHCRDTERLYQGHRVKRFQAIERVARRKLRMLDAATRLEDMKSPGSHLEALDRDRADQCSIRIHDQWRLCFIWKDGDAYAAEIVDYH